MLFSGLVLASMRFGGAIASVTLIFAGIFVAAQLIVAFVAKHERRAFATGFLIAAFAYALPHCISGTDALDPYSKNALPTTHGFQYLHRIFVTQTWQDYQTKAVVPDDDPRVIELKKSGGSVMMTPAGMVTLHETPSRLTFSLLTHAAIAFVLGFVGAAYAIHIHKTCNGV